jgi:glycosyltransferase involved in cell wall biosynthesis
MQSYIEEVMGLKSQDTYVVISAKYYAKNHSDIQIIPTMNVQTIKKDEVGDPDRVKKSRIVALGNFEDRVWSKSEKYAPVLRDESSRAMTSMAVEMGRREKQGDCKNAFVQSYLPKDETIICRPP